ncbi:MAG TPA: hypothetical protein VFN05_15120, partial [Actinomycetes bacterium]|nr:hypothetical protein [Actinomycetes bacterium]
MPWAVTRAEVPGAPRPNTLMATAGTSPMNGDTRKVVASNRSRAVRMPGSRRAATTPSAIVRSTRAGLPSARASGGTRTRARATRTAPKLTALNPNAQASPPAVMTSPASAGPTTRP